MENREDIGKVIDMKRGTFFWLIASLILYWFVNAWMGGGAVRGEMQELSYSTFLTYVQEGKIDTVSLDETRRTVRGPLAKNQWYMANIPRDDPELIPFLNSKNVYLTVAPPVDENSLFSILVGWIPFFLFIGLWVYFMRKMQGGGKDDGLSRIFGIGKSPAKRLNRLEPVTFEDVAGVDEAKQELREIVDFLKDPHKFEALGGRIPKGVLLVGPPGTGKTLLARAIAGEAGVPFFETSGSGFVEMFVGVGASRVRDMFEQGKKDAPCIIFIDEIDAMGRHRGAGLGGGHDEKEQTLNQLLAEMDGFETNTGIIIIAATNRPDVLDPALLRPGRFDRHVTVSNPDIVGREQILKVHTRNVPLAPDVDLRIIARGTPGFCGADLANLVNEAAILAARRDKTEVSMEEFEAAKDRVMMGTERRSMVMTDKDKRLTAYHEAGHALVSIKMPKTDPLHKVTIIPRGRALGLTMSLPEHDRLTYSNTELTSLLAVMFGGRIAEEIIFGKENITTGAGNDIQQATRLARRMVTEFGFSDALGSIRYDPDEQEVFLGHMVTQHKQVSEKIAALIDKEIRALIDTAEKTARQILTESREALDLVANALLEKETLTGDEVRKILDEGSHLD